MPILASFDPSPVTLLVVLILALLILGPGKLPEVAGALGKSIREFRRTSSELQDSIKLDPTPPAAASTNAPAPAPAAIDTASTPMEPDAKIRMLEERLAALEQERSTARTNSPS